MPRAGWCRECGDWVWVDPQGGCQNGHAPDCVQSIHEQPDPSRPEEPRPRGVSIGPKQHPSGINDRPVGVGDIPPSMQRFTWGAFALMPLWGALYGVWQVLSMFLLTLMTPILIASMSPANPSGAVIALVSVLSQVITSAIRLWVGMNAMGWLWKREALRLDRVPDAKPRFTVERFLAAQRSWAIAAACYLGFGLLGMLMMATSTETVVLDAMKRFGMTAELAWISIAWTIAEIVLALWLGGQMRKGTNPEPAKEQ